jgi:phosphoribosylformylglycinamidine synthase
MSHVKRIFVEKRPGLDIAAKNLFRDLRDNLGIKGLDKVRLLNRYDMEGISEEEYAALRDIVFAEPPLDVVYDETLPLADGERMFAIEYLPGQYDQRADSASQCIQIITRGSAPAVATARVVALAGNLGPDDFARIKNYCINPVDSREAAPGKPETLAMELDTPPDVAVINGFCATTGEALDALRGDLGLAMRYDDLAFCRDYFRDTEKRDPTLTEIRVLDTYWSDHCRHTTFLTTINEIDIEPSPFTAPIAGALEGYMSARTKVYSTNGTKSPKPRCLMDIATIGMKELRLRGLLDDLDSSEEINACSIEVTATVDGHKEPWLVMFKNETHNHPTEIEPFGGAATCLPRPALGPLLRVSRHARDRFGGPAAKRGGHASRQTAAAHNHHARRAGVQLLRQPDRPGHGHGFGGVRRRVRRETHGGRRRGGSGPQSQRTARTPASRRCRCTRGRPYRP